MGDTHKISRDNKPHDRNERQESCGTLYTLLHDSLPKKMNGLDIILYIKLMLLFFISFYINNINIIFTKRHKNIYI